jgi:hypothetical protein
VAPALWAVTLYVALDALGSADQAEDMKGTVVGAGE